MSVTVYLANQGFTLPATDFDDRRREAYFKNPADANNKLLPEEDKILVALGINKENAACLMPYLGRFFKELPKCQSDASLTLSKDCEIVQYVLWETMLAAKARSQQMYDDNFKTKKPWGDISVAINQQIINDLKPKPEDISDIDRIFTLILKANIPVDNTVDNLFTLIIKDGPPPPPVPPAPPVPPLPPGMAPIVGPPSELTALPVPPMPPLPPGMTPLVDPSSESDKQTPLSPQDSPSSSVITAPSVDTEEEPVSTGKFAYLGLTPQKIANQCGGKSGTLSGKDGKPLTETWEEQFKRSLYFFHCVKYKQPVDLAKGRLNAITEREFFRDWRTAVANKENENFLGITAEDATDRSELGVLYENYLNYRKPLLAYNCQKNGEEAWKFLSRFTGIFHYSDRALLYYLQQSTWVNGPTEVNKDTPQTLNAINVTIRTTEMAFQWKASGMPEELSIITTGISYNDGCSIKGLYINELALIHDIFEKGKNYVVDIHPWLMYIFNKDKYVQYPLEGSKVTRSINEWFLGNAFDGNYVPIQDERSKLDKAYNILGHGTRKLTKEEIKEIIHIVYYVACHAIATADLSYIPASFYSQPNPKKLSIIADWLKSATDKEYQVVNNGIQWVLKKDLPVSRALIVKLFTKGQTRNNKNRNSRNKTRSWKTNVSKLMKKSSIPLGKAPAVELPNIPTGVVPPPPPGGILPPPVAQNVELPNIPTDVVMPPGGVLPPPVAQNVELPNIPTDVVMPPGGVLPPPVAPIAPNIELPNIPPLQPNRPLPPLPADTPVTPAAPTATAAPAAAAPAPAPAPLNALTLARKAAAERSDGKQQVLKAPDVPKKGTRSWKNWFRGKKGMNNATMKNVLARAEPRQGSVAATLGIPRIQAQGQAAAPAAPAPPPVSTPRPGSVAAQLATKTAEQAAAQATAQAIQRIDGQVAALREQKTRLDEEFLAKKAELAKNIRTKPRDQQLRIVKNIKSLEQSKKIKQQTIDLRILPLNKQRNELIAKQTANLLRRAPKAPTSPIVIPSTGEEPSSDPTVRALQEQVARNAAMIAEDRRRRAISSGSNTNSNTDNNTDSVSSNNSEEARNMLEGRSAPISAANEELLRTAGITSNKRSRNRRRTRRKRNT